MSSESNWVFHVRWIEGFMDLLTVSFKQMANEAEMNGASDQFCFVLATGPSADR